MPLKFIRMFARVTASALMTTYFVVYNVEHIYLQWSRRKHMIYMYTSVCVHMLNSPVYFGSRYKLDSMCYSFALKLILYTDHSPSLNLAS